ncbi:WcbI family polysaccharide biosynthesis putative acetyltransferase [Alloyangia pacifica]|uniref:WcbI family polysaccharide biosynthesis putative acetyltransferase n=1 Tax=Alloyangia pacifica TaxID=311180 RepID=UPI0031CE0A0C
MSRILVVSNCATQGLISGLQLLCPGLEVQGYEIGQARGAPGKLRQDAAQSDVLVLLPGVAGMLEPELMDRKTVLTVPSLFFSGYHPDTVYLEKATGQQVRNGFGAYHSLICFAAHRAGLSQSETLALYRGETYASLGYFNEWDIQKHLLLENFRKQGLELSGLFLSWVRGGCFMYTINHPRVRCFLDLARLLALRLGLAPLDYDVLPRDALAVGSVYPCYPEIAEACGSRGSTLFKLDSQDRVITLPQFIAMCFQSYDTHAGAGLRPAPAFADKLARFETQVLGRFGAGAEPRGGLR